jgi:Na+/H+ antiporter NhaC
MKARFQVAFASWILGLVVLAPASCWAMGPSTAHTRAVTYHDHTPHAHTHTAHAHH